MRSLLLLKRALSLVQTGTPKIHTFDTLNNKTLNVMAIFFVCGISLSSSLLNGHQKRSTSLFFFASRQEDHHHHGKTEGVLFFPKERRQRAKT